MSLDILGNKLKELRDSQSMTQEDLGDILNVTPKQIQRYEKGEVLPDYNKMMILKGLFKYDFYSLLCEPKKDQFGEINTNLKELKGYTIAILTEQKAGQHVMIESLERLEGKPVGELRAIAGILATELQESLNMIHNGKKTHARKQRT